MKVTCFGHDQRAGRFSFGSCNHPCNARRGCEYQSKADDVERFDTTITVPFNIDGDYVLQMVAYVGVSLSPVYSCSRIKVSGGDVTRACTPPAAIPTPVACKNVGTFAVKDIVVGSTAGAYCFGSNTVILSNLGFFC